MNSFLKKTSFWLALYLQREVSGYRSVSSSEAGKLEASLQPGDILLVEGNLRISVAIKYLTQSTWSHAAFYTGPIEGQTDEDGKPLCLVEADVIKGVIASPLSKYERLHTRICRAVDLSDEDREKAISFMIGKIGMQYDIKNVIDLMRFLLLTPPVPTRFRRRMLALGSGDPTRAICSTLIAQAFQFIKYPILPKVTEPDGKNGLKQEIMDSRHYSLFTPRDFDISPYFQIIKPTIDDKFDYKTIAWNKTVQGDDIS